MALARFGIRVHLAQKGAELGLRESAWFETWLRFGGKSGRQVDWLKGVFVMRLPPRAP